MNNAITFDSVSVFRGKSLILDDISFEVATGQIIGLLGPSGAGKTTIMRSILGIQAGVQGSIKVLGLETSNKALQTRVAYSTQSSSVFDDLTIQENLEFAAVMLGVSKERVIEVLTMVDLTRLAKQKVIKLSGGEKNRVSLAMALIGDPEVLVLDEPTVGLDPVLRAQLWKLFRDLADQGKTLLISSHVMSEAERCDQLMFIRDGKLIALDSLANVLKQTKTKSAEEAFLKLAEKVTE